MHPIFGRVMKYILRVILIFILSLLFVGLVKYRGDVGAYFNFLNTRDWNQARGELSISKPTTFADMFRWSGKVDTMTGIDLLSGELFTGDILTGTTGLDAYDPSMEADLNATTDSSNSGFGFKNTDTTTAPSSWGEAADSAKAQLLNLIKKREMNK